MRWLILIMFLFVLNYGYAQEKENEYKRMIDSAVSLKSREFLKSYEGRPQGSEPTEGNLYLIDENNLPYKYGGSLTGLRLKTINIFEAKNKNALKKGVHAWKIIPTLISNRLKISIIDFFITYKNGNYNYANGGGSETIFEYVCNENKWVLIKSKNQGL
jgi:hypothetical protein